MEVEREEGKARRKAGAKNSNNAKKGRNPSFELALSRHSSISTAPGSTDSSFLPSYSYKVYLNSRFSRSVLSANSISTIWLIDLSDTSLSRLLFSHT